MSAEVTLFECARNMLLGVDRKTELPGAQSFQKRPMFARDIAADEEREP